jgi:hypothetical protein
MSTPKLSLEHLLYLLALALALFLRLLNLGAAPLSDFEATWALQALQAANPQGAAPQFGAQTAYLALTTPVFFLFSASNFAARLWPALAGSFLVLVPWLLRKQLGRVSAVLVAFGLALDPGLVATSRLAGGPMLALFFGMLALALWLNRKALLAGISLGLLLLSGPAAVTGVLIFGVVALLLRWLRLPLSTSFTGPLERRDLRLALSAVVGVILLGGSLFLRYPQALAGWANTLPSYFQTWSLASGVPAGQSLLALLVYQPFPILLLVVGLLFWLVDNSLNLGAAPAAEQDAAGATPDEEDFPGEDHPASDIPLRSSATVAVEFPPVFPTLWLLASLLLVLLPPGRQVADLVWALPALWILAVWGLAADRRPAGSLLGRLADLRLDAISLSHAGATLLLFGLFWNTLISTRGLVGLQTIPTPGLRLVITLIVLILLFLTAMLVSIGWDWRTSRSGLLLGVTAAFAIYSFAALWGVSQLHPNRPEELWAPQPATVQADLLLQTIRDLSKWQTSLRNDIEIWSAVDLPSLRWLLRDFHNARFVSELLPDQSPALAITLQTQTPPSLAESYRGQDFLWQVWPGWDGAAPPDFLAWLTFRKAPTQQLSIILWARADLKPDLGTPQTSPDLPDPDLQEP